MNTPFIDIAETESLEEFLSNANGSPAILFKHSNTCGVSSRAYGEMSKLTHPVGIVVVQHARSVSDEIERRWNVAHETPQVLIVRDGKVVWDASHSRVKAADVEAVLEQAN